MASRRAAFDLSSLRLIGMVHLPALPGAAQSRLSMDNIVEQAVAEARLLIRAGFDAVIVENFGDAPFHAEMAPRETVAAMGIVVREVARSCGGPVGVNVLRNDALSALAVAAVAGSAFIRVNVLSGVYATDQGFVTGRPAEVLAQRNRLAPSVRIAADVHVKHAVPISQPDIALAAEETVSRAGADAVIVSGSGTGKETDLSSARHVRQAVGEAVPVWIGSGVTPQTVADCLAAADAVIVGTSLKRGGRTLNAIDPARVRALVRAARV